MGNELSCASGEKSNKAQKAEERYQASAPLDAAPAANGKDGQQQAAAADAAAPSPVDEPALTADAAAPDLNAAINLDETAGADRPLADAGTAVAVAAGTEGSAAACIEEPVVAIVSAPVQLSEAPPPAAPQPEIVVCPPCDVEQPEGELSGDIVPAAALEEREPVAPSDAGSALAEPAAAACSVDVIVSPPPAAPCDEQPLAEDDVVVSVAAEQSEAQLPPPQPVDVVTTIAAQNEEALSDEVPPPQIAVCPPYYPDAEQPAAEATAGADAGAAVAAADSTDHPSVPVIELPDNRPVIIGPCAVAPWAVGSSAEAAAADVQLAAATEQPQQEEQDGEAAQQPEPICVTCDPVPLVTSVGHASAGEACSAYIDATPVAVPEIELVLPPPEPIVGTGEEPALDGGEAPLEIDGSGPNPSTAEEEDSIAAAVLAAGNRSLELSVDPQPEATASAEAAGAAAVHVDVSAPVPAAELVAGATEKLNGSAADGEAALPGDGHETDLPTSPVSPTATDASGLAQKKAKTAASPHSRIPVLQE